MTSGFLTPITWLCAILGMSSVLILLFFNKRNIFANRLLAISLFSLTWVWISDLLIQHKWLLHAPHLHLISHPLHFLIPALSYLYVRALTNEESWFRAYDGLHFIPFFLHLFDLTPFYLLGAEEKRAVIEMHIANPDLISQLQEGHLPPYWHLKIKAIIGLIYMFFQWRLVLAFIRNLKNGRSVATAVLASWLKVFTFLMTFIYLGVIFTLALKLSQSTFFAVVRLPLCMTNLLILGFLLFRPSILYGLFPNGVPDPRPNLMKTDQEDAEDDKKSILTDRQISFYARHIERYMNAEKAYLKNGFTLNDMARDLNIPRHHLSACINEHYKMNFNDFINRYRINHICDKITPDKWNDLTLEGIGREAGFNSRSTFYKAFKKVKGMNPSEYRQQVDAN